MANQKKIAEKAGVTQATVSMALRNHPAINTRTRELVQRVARELDYRPNPLVSSLMVHIRSGRHLRDQGTLAIVVGQGRGKTWREAWRKSEVYSGQLRGVCERAEKLGYRGECFYLSDYGSGSRLDQVLYSRGIVGVLFMPPMNLTKTPVRLRSEKYAFSGVAYSWPDLSMHRAAAHHRYNMELAFRELQARGFRRIGLCLPPAAVEGVEANWLLGFLHWQWKSPAKQCIPLLVAEHGPKGLPKFVRWFKRHSPDVVLTLTGYEKQWIEGMGLRVPEDVGVACVNRSRDQDFSGVDENHEEVGAAAVDMLIHQIQHNERGFPEMPRLLLIKGVWRDGKSLCSR